MPDIVKQISIKNPQASGQYETKDIGANAENVSYTNTSTSIDATNVQDALTELDDELGSLSSVVSGKSTVTAVSGQITSNTIEQIQINDNIYNIPSGTTVVANPTMAGTEEDLTSIQIGSTKYNNPVGSTVIANPTGTSGNNLTRIKIDGVDYNISGGSAVSDLDDLGNVDITTPTNGQVLKYDSANQKWVNANEDSGSTVTWNQITQTGTKIATVNIDGTATDVYAPTSGGGGTSSLAGLDDVTITSASNDQDLSYDSTSSKWINKTHRVELTKAQYDALPSSKLTDGIEYFITDMETTGVEIVANPEGSPTDELSSIQIGDEIYSISGGGGSSQKVLQMKTKTYIGDDTTPLVVTFDEIPKCIYSIYGNGLNNTQVRITPFVYGENRATSWYISPTSTNSGMLYNWITYSNDNKTMTISSNASDAGAHWNISGETYTITYFIEVNSGGGSASWKDITGTLTAGQTEITLNNSAIHENSTFDFYTNKFGVNPTNISVLSGSITLTFDEQSTDLGVKVRVS